MAKDWHNKHVSTKWGIAILGFFVISIALLIPMLNQYQDLRSSAAGGISCPSNLVAYEIYRQGIKCVGYVKTVDSANWICSNAPRNSIDSRTNYYDYKGTFYNKLLSNCYNFGSNVVNGRSRCQSGYHLYSGVKQSASKATCVKDKSSYI